MVQIQKAIKLLQSKDTEENAEGQEIWATLYDDQVVPDPSFVKSKKSSYLDPGNYDVDHAVPLAWHWEFQGGNDIEYGDRWAVAGGESNLKLMWGSLNRAKGSKGPDGNAGRYTNKFWVGKNFTHQYSGDKRLPDDSTPFANMKKKR